MLANGKGPQFDYVRLFIGLCAYAVVGVVVAHLIAEVISGR